MEGVREFCSPVGQSQVGLGEFYGNDTEYAYMQDEHNTGWSMTIWEADLNAVMNHGGVALLPEQLRYITSFQFLKFNLIMIF